MACTATVDLPRGINTQSDWNTNLGLGEEGREHEAEHDERPAVEDVDEEDVAVAGVGEHVAEHQDHDADGAHDEHVHGVHREPREPGGRAPSDAAGTRG